MRRLQDQLPRCFAPSARQEHTLLILVSVRVLFYTCVKTNDALLFDPWMRCAHCWVGRGRKHFL